MRLYGFTCSGCSTYHRTIDGYRRPDGELSIQCPDCGEIERVRKYRGTLEAVAK